MELSCAHLTMLRAVDCILKACNSINGLRKVAVLPSRASISSIHGPFFSYGSCHFSGDLIASSLIGGCG